MMFGLGHDIVDPDVDLVCLTSWLQKRVRVNERHDERNAVRRMAFVIIIHLILCQRSCHEGL